MEPPKGQGEENAPRKIPGSQPADSGQAEAESAVAVSTGKPEAAAAVASAATAIDAIRRLPRGPGVEQYVTQDELRPTQTQNLILEIEESEIENFTPLETTENLTLKAAEQNFTLEAPVGYVFESPGHGQVSNYDVLTVSQSSATNNKLSSADAISAIDMEVQTLSAVQEGGIKLHPTQNFTPQPFVYNFSVPSRAQSRILARSQNNELVELMTKFVADNRDEMFRREQQAVKQAWEKTRLELELAILQTQLQYATSGLVRSTADSDFLLGTAITVFQGGSEKSLPLGLTHTAAHNLYGRPIVSHPQHDATAALGEGRMSAQHVYSAAGRARSTYQVECVTSAGRLGSVSLRHAVSDVSNVGITRPTEGMQTARSVESSSFAAYVSPAATDNISLPVYTRPEPTLTEDNLFAQAVSKPLQATRCYTQCDRSR